MFDMTALNRAVAEAMSSAKSVSSSEENNSKAKNANDNDYSTADSLFSFSDVAKERLSKGNFHTISEVFVQLDLMATMKSAAVNKKVDQLKEASKPGSFFLQA